MLRVWADFAEIEAGRTWQSLRDVSGDVDVGMFVQLWDHDGNTCRARVIELDAVGATFEIEQGTWRSAES